MDAWLWAMCIWVKKTVKWLWHFCLAAQMCHLANHKLTINMPHPLLAFHSCWLDIVSSCLISSLPYSSYTAPILFPLFRYHPFLSTSPTSVLFSTHWLLNSYLPAFPPVSNKWHIILMIVTTSLFSSLISHHPLLLLHTLGGWMEKWIKRGCLIFSLCARQPPSSQYRPQTHHLSLQVVRSLLYMLKQESEHNVASRLASLPSIIDFLILWFATPQLVDCGGLA